MREKLIAYVRSLFRYAPQNQDNQDLEAEILQNSLDRFDDLVSQGIPEDSAYRQTVESIGDVRQLLTADSKPETGKNRKARRIAIACTAVVLVLAAVPLLLFGLIGPRRLDRMEDRVERWANQVEREADHWAEGIEEGVERWVDTIDDEFGYSVILPNSTIDYTDSDRYAVGDAVVKAASLEDLSINWFAGTVTVEAWDGDTISITESGAGSEAEQLHWLLEDGSLDIEYCAAGTHKTLPRKELTVRLPNKLAENLKNLNIFGTSQDMVVTDISALSAKFHSVSGTLDYSGGAERLRLETTSGNMTVKLSKAPDDLEFDSVSGDLELIFPDGRGFKVDWNTVSGKFDCAFPGQKEDEDEWIFNPEENYAIRGEYDFDTVSGNVTIKKG